jgi:tRNAThr (cytosine32-N3)-methyltransferase
LFLTGSKGRFNSDPQKWWNIFYQNNTSNFFKDRKWLHQEFPVLTSLTQEDSPPVTIVEVGAGAGNTAFPILAQNKNPRIRIHAVDFSKKAVELIRGNEAYDGDKIMADVWDAASDTEQLPPNVEEGSVDVVIMIFIFSALSPQQWKSAVRNVHRCLKPGGEVLFRDYGRGDLAQVRFKKGRYMEENFYVRGDGTRVYFFDRDELAVIWSSWVDEEANPTVTEDATQSATVDKVTGEDRDETAPLTGFEVVDLGVDRRLLVNRQRKLKMYRCWMQGRFRKRGGTPLSTFPPAAESSIAFKHE